MAYDNDIIPAFYSLVPAVGGVTQSDSWVNKQLRQGEVKKVIPPDSKDSRSKLFYEYDVLVAHRANQGVIHKLYHNCFLNNPLAGFADKSYFTLRASDIQDGSAKSGNGSRVLVLCLDGNENQAFIIGGIKSPKDPDENKGHHLLFEFNGVLFEINDDGSWSITNKGKTDIKGEADSKRDAAGAGTKVQVEANGNFVVTTPNNQTVKVDNKANTIDVESATVNINAQNVNLGALPAFSNVKGEPLAALLAQICTMIAPTLPTPWQQAAMMAIVPQISTILSSTVKGQG